jgi:hypothetical protein
MRQILNCIGCSPILISWGGFNRTRNKKEDEVPTSKINLNFIPYWNTIILKWNLNIPKWNRYS